MRKKLIIATRESPLALKQTEYVRGELQKRFPELSIEFLGMTTKGDRFLEKPLQKVGGKGLFVKELEEAIINGQADFAVHSLKDVPYELPEGLVLGAFLKRGSPYDAFVSNQFSSFWQLPLGAKVGTSSLRRGQQLKYHRPDLQIESVRGNLQTRIRKLDEGLFDALILAEAGLERMGLTSKIKHTFSAEEVLPAIGQGVIAVECRKDDEALLKMLQSIHCYETASCIQAERAFNTKLQGGCHTPIAAFACIEQKHILLRGYVASMKNNIAYCSSIIGKIEEPVKIGELLAERLLAAGAIIEPMPNS